MRAYPNLKPLPSFFLIKIGKIDQKERKNKIGNIFIPQTTVFMTREVQYGEIVHIGERAGKAFPEAEIGDTLLIHYFVSGKQSEDADEGRYKIDEDEKFNYYLVTAMSHNGRQNESYGVVKKDGTIITHKDYILLETEKPAESDLPPDEFINKSISKTKGGLFLFNQWKESREEKGAKMAELKNRVQELSKSGIHLPHVAKGIRELEMEMDVISKDISKKQYLPYSVAAFNPILNEWFDAGINAGDVIYMYNIACNTKIEYNAKEYIVAKSDYIGTLYKPMDLQPVAGMSSTS